MCIMGWLGQYKDMATDWMNGEFWFDSLQGQQRLFSLSQHLDWLWNRSNHFFCGYQRLFLHIYCGWEVELTTHSHLMLRLRMYGVTVSLPMY